MRLGTGRRRSHRVGIFLLSGLSLYFGNREAHQLKKLRKIYNAARISQTDLFPRMGQLLQFFWTFAERAQDIMKGEAVN